jgi:RecB family endonuclease NucS
VATGNFCARVVYRSPVPPTESDPGDQPDANPERAAGAESKAPTAGETGPERASDAGSTTTPPDESSPSAGDEPRDAAGVADGRVRAVSRPDAESAREVVAAGVERGDLVTVVGRCTVDYDGRAASTLGAGDRQVVLKPDGTAMVHTDEGRQPVNWQPPGCEHEVSLEAGDLRVRSTRETPAEELVVDFESVLAVTAFDLVDEEELSLSGTHEDLKDRVLDEPDRVEPGFSPLATERETPAGAVDVFGEDRDGRTVVLELKRSRAGPDAVGQLERYVEALRRDLHADAEVRGLLVAPSATDRARTLLAERGLEFVDLEPDPETG